MQASRFLMVVAAAAACSCSGTGAAQRGTFETGAGGDNALISTGTAGDSMGTTSGNTGGTTGLRPGSTAGDGGGCNDLTVNYDKLIPSVLLLVDESGSMFDNKYPVGGAASRWEVVHNTILDPNGFVKSLEGKVRFGLATFTSDNNNLATCPIMAGKTNIALGNYAAISAAYPGINRTFNYKGDTPTGAAIKASAKILAAVTDPGPKFILLATDGDPDDCTRADPNCGQDETVAETQAAYAQKIGTFVIGISDDVHAFFLQDIANAGAGLPVVRHIGADCDPNQPPPYLGTYATAATTNAMYYAPADQTALTNALNVIIGAVRSCVLEMHGKIDLPRANEGTVTLDGTDLKYGDPNGWKAVDETHVQIAGQACAKINAEDKAALHITFPCEVYTPIN